MINSEIMLSILVITYQHKNYIRKCLDSVFMQKTIFNYEVIIADDFSTDGTREIIKEFKKKYGEKIKLVLQRKNHGATRNSYYAAKMARGKYVIAVDGDDYWIDENKLQKQVDYLENHPERMGVFHKCRYVDENGKILNKRHEDFYPIKNNYSMRHFEKGILPGQTSTFMFRNGMVDYKMIPRLHNMVGDQTLYVALLAQGDFGFIDEIMSMYTKVCKSNATNACSIAKFNNYTDVMWMYYYNLEKYIRNTYKQNINLKYLRVDQTQTAWNKLKEDISITNLKIYFRILLYSYIHK